MVSMVRRLWLSASYVLMTLTILIGSISGMRELTRLSSRLDELRRDVEEASQDRSSCVDEGYGISPKLNVLKSAFAPMPSSALYSSEVGTIDEGRTWRPLRTFEPTAREALPRPLGMLVADGDNGMLVPWFTINQRGVHAVSFDRGETWSRADEAYAFNAKFTALTRDECIAAIHRAIDSIASERRESLLIHALATSFVWLFIWSIYRWGLWVASGRWKPSL